MARTAGAGTDGKDELIDLLGQLEVASWSRIRKEENMQRSVMNFHQQQRKKSFGRDLCALPYTKANSSFFAACSQFRKIHFLQ